MARDTLVPRGAVGRGGGIKHTVCVCGVQLPGYLAREELSGGFGYGRTGVAHRAGSGGGAVVAVAYFKNAIGCRVESHNTADLGCVCGCDRDRASAVAVGDEQRIACGIVIRHLSQHTAAAEVARHASCIEAVGDTQRTAPEIAQQAAGIVTRSYVARVAAAFHDESTVPVVIHPRDQAAGILITGDDIGCVATIGHRERVSTWNLPHEGGCIVTRPCSGHEAAADGNTRKMRIPD